MLPQPTEDELHLALAAALKEKLFFNPLKRFLYHEERRLQKTFVNILESMPPALLELKIGTLIDASQGRITDPSLDGDTLNSITELLLWVCRLFGPAAAEVQKEEEDQKEFPATKKARISQV